MKHIETKEERQKRFKKLSSTERKILIREKLKMQGLEEGSGVLGKNQLNYDKEEIIDLLLLTRCFLKK